MSSGRLREGASDASNDRDPLEGLRLQIGLKVVISTKEISTRPGIYPSTKQRIKMKNRCSSRTICELQLSFPRSLPFMTSLLSQFLKSQSVFPMSTPMPSTSSRIVRPLPPARPGMAFPLDKSKFEVKLTTLAARIPAATSGAVRSSKLVKRLVGR